MYGDNGYDVGIKGYSIYVEVGVRSMFRNAERTFTNAERTFPTAECRFTIAEHKTDTLLLVIRSCFRGILNKPVLII